MISRGRYGVVNEPAVSGKVGSVTVGAAAQFIAGRQIELQKDDVIGLLRRCSGLFALLSAFSFQLRGGRPENQERWSHEEEKNRR